MYRDGMFLLKTSYNRYELLKTAEQWGCCVAIVLTSILLLILALVLACRFSSLARYHVKSFTVYAFLLLNCTLAIPYGLLHFGKFYETCLFASRRVHWVSRLLGIRWKVECDERVDRKRSYVVVCNHQSVIDVLAMMVIWPTLGPTASVAKRELKYLAGPFSLLLHLCGTIFIDRKSNDGHRTLNEAGLSAKRSGTSLWLFPEGTRNKDRHTSMLPFKKGAFHLAVDAGLPILPVVISRYDFLDPSRKRFDRGTATIRVLSPISTEGFGKESLENLAEMTRERMMEALLRMSGGGSDDAKKYL